MIYRINDQLKNRVSGRIVTVTEVDKVKILLDGKKWLPVDKLHNYEYVGRKQADAPVASARSAGRTGRGRKTSRK